ncbi:hypothetical protein Asulf_00394 [Archaeoglobus sulfaticallidus PM70-1]|uniref:Ribbon-helix-helix protein CopG domain-containing protein n=1 Tax=Archaeoglobus sulfaticallidus PM70-1 TaxID=387631 RepID=N0BIX1_9EURY|nr:hypothetical protein [Archaeoglobus sulfaticallidus]AGK60421.1 hypothetical protein Asulf_00394 [Archaeoglobus sulfaticallidus PM70-1]
MSLKTRRLSIAVDNYTYKVLEDIVKKEQKSMSEVVRNSIRILSKLSRNGNLESLENALVYSELLSCREHVIVDIEIWSAILEIIDEKKKEEFFEIVRKVGFEHGIQYRERGLRTVEEILKYMEYENWFRLKVNSDKTYTLVLSAKSEQKILEVFLRGVFDAMKLNTEIKDYYRKLIIVEN